MLIIIAKNIEPSLWTWPEFSSMTFVWVFAILMSALLAYLVVNYVYRRQVMNNAAREMVISYARKRSLDQKEFLLIDEFLTSLTEKGYDIAEVFMNKGHLHSTMFEFFAKDKRHPEDMHVRILDKLFPEKEQNHQVLSPADLREGEVCGIAVGQKHYLGTVLKSQSNLLLLHIEGLKEVLNGKTVHIYVYRQILGGYEIEAKVIETEGMSIKAAFTGEIQRKGDAHIMTFLSCSVSLVPFFFPDEFTDSTFEEEYTGITLKISDRSVLFEPTNVSAADDLARHELWDMNIMFPDGMSVSVKGKVMQSRNPRKFILKILQVSDEDRSVLMDKILSESPVREVIE